MLGLPERREEFNTKTNKKTQVILMHNHVWNFKFCRP